MKKMKSSVYSSYYIRELLQNKRSNCYNVVKTQSKVRFQ